jgi:hypothetical protein
MLIIGVPKLVVKCQLMWWYSTGIINVGIMQYGYELQLLGFSLKYK